MAAEASTSWRSSLKALSPEGGRANVPPPPRAQTTVRLRMPTPHSPLTWAGTGGRRVECAHPLKPAVKPSAKVLRVYLEQRNYL